MGGEKQAELFRDHLNREQQPRASQCSGESREGSGILLLTLADGADVSSIT